LKKKISTLPAWITMIVIIGLDQLTKSLIRSHLYPYQSIDIWGSFLRFTHLQNTGAAFSLSLPNDSYNRIFFIATSLLATVLIIYLLHKAFHKIQVWGLGLVLGGALGNLIDRIIRGGVTDFLDFDIPDMFGMQRFPVFNVADSAIFIGMVLLIIDTILVSGKQKAPLESEETPSDVPAASQKQEPNHQN